MEYVQSVQLITISIKKVSAALSSQNVKHSTSKSVFVKPAIKATQSRMDSVSQLMLQTLKIKDAKPGKMEYALNALQDGISVPTMFVTQFLTSAELGIKQQELVIHAIKAMQFKVQAVLEMQLIYNHQLIHYAVSGKLENAKNVLIELIFIMESALQYQITVKHGMLLTEDV